MLRIAREVAWLRDGSCTDQVISAAETTPANAIRPRPVSSPSRRTSASRIEVGRWLTRGMTRSIAGIEAVGLRPRQIAARYHAHAGIAIKLDARGFVAAVLADIEPDAEAAGR